MKPNLFRLSDWSILLAPVLILSLVSYGLIYGLTHSITNLGIIISSIVIASVLVIVLLFYVDRWLFISTFTYTTNGGVSCYFERGTTVYLISDVEPEIEKVLNKFAKEFPDKKDKILSGIYINKSICIFKTDVVFRIGQWQRLVYGAAGVDWIVVGQGNRMIEDTAFAHELGHLHLNRQNHTLVSEEESHKILSKIGL